MLNKQQISASNILIQRLILDRLSERFGAVPQAEDSLDRFEADYKSIVHDLLSVPPSRPLEFSETRLAALESLEWRLGTIPLENTFSIWRFGIQGSGNESGSIPVVAEELTRAKVGDLPRRIAVVDWLKTMPLVAMKIGGKFVLEDGSHRACAGWLAGKREMRAFIGHPTKLQEQALKDCLYMDDIFECLARKGKNGKQTR